MAETIALLTIAVSFWLGRRTGWHRGRRALEYETWRRYRWWDS